MLPDKSGEITSGWRDGLKANQYLVVNVTGDGSKVQCCKGQHCLETWNVRSMNQGKLEMVKQEMARVNIDLGISELKWAWMGKFNSDDHYIYYCVQESLRRNWVALIVNQRVWNSVVGCNLKNDRMISVHFQGKPFNITVIPSLCPKHWCWRSWTWLVLWRLTTPSRTNTQKIKNVLFIIRGLECKGRKSRYLE